MTFSELAAEIKKLPPDELRSDSAQLFECVFDTKSSGKLTAALEGFFGTALKPAGQSPTKELKACSDQFGGVRDNQTLYFAEREGISYCALIWPWSDETKATLKVFPTKVKIASGSGAVPSLFGKIRNILPKF